MKDKKEMFRKFIKAAVMTVMAGALLLGAPAVKTQAATRNVAANKVVNRAPALKVGINRVTAKYNNSYVKFTAPAKGTYKITIYNIATIKGRYPDYNLGNFYIKKYTGNGYYKYLSHQTVSTQGGKSWCLYTATPASYNRFYRGKKVTTGTYLASRYGKLSLRKGETVYMQYFYTGSKCTYNVKISK